MSNQAAWLTAPKVAPFKVAEAPRPTPGPGEVLVKNAAWAINPVDWKVQDTGYFLQEFPNILGEDVAGTIEEVGEGVTKYTKGQRVMAYPIALGNKKKEYAGFQLYTLAPTSVVAPIPDSLSFAQASVLPLALSTAIIGLYPKDNLALPYPTVEQQSTPVGRTILVLGGSSSVGSVAVQLARASGLTVISTASPKNHAFVKSLGAAEVYDPKDPEFVSKVVDKYAGSNFAGVYDAIGLSDTLSTAVTISAKLGGKIIISTLGAQGEVAENATKQGIQIKGVFAALLPLTLDDVCRAVWEGFVPAALESGALKALPEALVVGKGLESIQKGLDTQKAGVSAKKVVVEL